MSTKVLNLGIISLLCTPVNMVFNFEEFLKAPDAHVIETLKKDELFEFVTKFHLNIRRVLGK